MTFHFFSKKKVSKNIPIFRRRRSSGFALMVALGLMSFVLLIILGLSTLVQVNSNITSAEKRVRSRNGNIKNERNRFIIIKGLKRGN